jgi:DNA-binding response OmpR family regulator/HPt (histidine-containing phosphotransfer) domain-containing protein
MFFKLKYFSHGTDFKCVINLDGLLFDFGNDFEGVVVYIESILESSPTWIQSFQEAIKRKDFSEIHRQAHSIKAVALSVGNYEIGNLTRKVEAFCREKNFQEILHLGPIFLSEYSAFLFNLEVSMENLRTQNQEPKKEKNLGKILVIDDDLHFGKGLQTLLGNQGYNVNFETNPSLAAEMVEKEKYDLMLLDIIMPNISGLEVLKEIRMKYHYLQFPVIMISMFDDNQDIVQALDLGANDFISKPINFTVIRARIRNHMEQVFLYKQSLALERLKTTKALVATYNHELNNSISKAFGNFDESGKGCQVARKELEKNLNEIAEITRKIGMLDAEEIELEDYVGNAKMVKLG